MSKALNNLFWHDGNLSGISFVIDHKGKSSLVLAASLYKNEQASKRDEYKVECEGILEFYSTIDATELKTNMFAGNISNGYLKESTLWVYFTDGMLKVCAKKFRLVKC